MDFDEDTRFPYHACGEDCQIHDTKERVWRHLKFFQYRCYIHAKVPRIKCEKHGEMMIDVPCGREGSEFTLTVDRIHVMKLMGESVDNVRKRKRRCRDKRKRNLSDGTRYIWLKNRARGFRNRENFKDMIYFCMGGFEFHFLPIM